MIREHGDRTRSKGRKKDPMGNFADGVNQSQTGDIGELARGGCLTNIVTIAIVIIVLAFFLLK